MKQPGISSAPAHAHSPRLRLGISIVLPRPGMPGTRLFRSRPLPFPSPSARDFNDAPASGDAGDPALHRLRRSASASATPAGTRSETSPPNVAISFTPVDDRKL